VAAGQGDCSQERYAPRFERVAENFHEEDNRELPFDVARVTWSANKSPFNKPIAEERKRHVRKIESS
jgi:hypothetical protein